MLFFLSLISAFVTPSEPTLIVVVYAAIIFASTLIWFLIHQEVLVLGHS
jgi:threonine/homoserine/homoserine lactone efflux protein